MNQEEEEKLVMDLFRKNFTQFPKGKVVKSESPDFIIRGGPHQHVGIELTRLPLDQPGLFENIDNSIAAKNEKLPLYKHILLNEIWLIIYTDDLTILCDGNIEQELKNREFESRFSKVFLFDLFENKIYSLGIC